MVQSLMPCINRLPPGTAIFLEASVGGVWRAVVNLHVFERV